MKKNTNNRFGRRLSRLQKAMSNSELEFATKYLKESAASQRSINRYKIDGTR